MVRGTGRHATTRRRWGALTAAFALLAGFVTVTTVGLGVGVSAAAGDVDGTVSGAVFQDFGSTGIYTTGDAGAGVPRNRPIAGITATAYDADGDEVGTATSVEDGTYTIDVTDARSEDLRIEFSGWDPEIYQPGFAVQTPVPADALGSNDTSVQFVTLDTDDAEHVDLALIIPDQVIQANAPISTAIEYAGDPADPDNALTDSDAVVAQPWADFGAYEDPGWPFGRVTLASFQEVGSVWGTSYIRNGNRMLASPTVKRMSGLGLGGLGGIYRIPDVLNADGSLASNPPDPDVWFDVEDLTIVGGGGATVDLGDIPDNAGRGLGDHDDPATDIDAFSGAARIGIGGMATSLDGRAMFVTNLNDKSIYGIDIADPDSTPALALKIPTPVGDNQQLWAITTHSNRLYLGYVDTGARPGLSADAAGMQAHVVSTSVDNLVDAVVRGLAVSPLWQTELTVDLGYVKGSNMEGWPTRDTPTPETPSTCPNSQSTAQEMDDWFPQLTRWNSWTDSWSWDADGAAVQTDDPFNAAVQADGGTVGLPGGCSYGTGWEQVYPQPVLSGLTFDIDGYLILGFTDRNAIQSGNRNHAAIASPTGDRYWEAISNGDTLIAAPAALAGTPPAGCPAPVADERFVLECNGVVGTRGPRTAAAGTPAQNPTYNNDEGPVTGEFLNDRRDQGTAANHNENTLGSVVTYPGVDEIASSAMDPYTGINRNGLMWFNQETGVATRGFDQVIGADDSTSETFQKGGGLGSVALLGVASPVEIGNRVWLDADLNGRQDPDEPGINGAPVELWWADPADPATPVCQIGDTTTASVNGQPGTYYFRSDQPALQDQPCAAAGGPVSFTTDANYVVVFPQGTGAVQLVGPNATHPGFAGLTWDQLQRTAQEATRPAPTPTTEFNDSNPDVSTGRAPVSVGGPGENNHSIDAGWYGLAPFQVEKTVTGTGPPDTEYTVNVLAATNFRGDDRLAAAGPLPDPRDPQVTKTEYVLTPGTPVASGEDYPYGYTLTLKETDPVLPDDAVRYDPADPADPTQALVVVNPTNSGGDAVALEVTNDYGSFQVVKTNTGDAEAVAAVGDLEFTVNWTSDQPEVVDGDTEGSFTVTGDGTAAPDPALSFPVGTEVTLSEVEPTSLPPGVTWSGGTWTAAPPNVVANDDGTATVTIAGNDEEPVEVGLTNTFENALGNFTLTKEIAPDSDFPDLADPIYDTVQIPVDYSYTDLETGDEVTGTYTLNRANNFTITSPDFPTGTVFTLTEGTPTGLPVNMEMTFEGWTVDGEPATSPVTFTIGDDTTTALVVTNSTREKVGTFEVSKEFADADGTAIDPDDPRLADVVVTITWTGPDDTTGTIELTQANGWTAGPTDAQGDPVTFPLGTMIDLEETGITGVPPSLELTDDVTWTPADPEDATKGQVTIGDEEVAAQATVVNGTDVLVGTFDLRKALSEGSDPADLTDPELESVSFTVEATWEDQPDIGTTAGSAVLILNSDNDWTTSLGQTLPVGTVVTLSEISVDGLPPNIEWDGTPAWGDNVTTNDDGTATLTITESEQTPEIVVTNTLNKLLGTFEIAKEVDGDLDLDSPELADVEFTVTASWPAGLGIDAGSVELALNADNSFTAPAGVNLPTGTVVTLSEATPSGTPPDVGWGDITWSGDGLTVNDDDGTASFTIGDDTNPTFTVTNTAEKLTGTFGVAKKVNGDFDLDSPELAEAAFTVTASWPAETGQDAGSVKLVLNQGNDFAAPAGVQLAVGTVVTLSEATPSGTGASVQWGDIAWAGEGLTLHDDGTASFTIGNNTAPVFTVTNTAEELTGTFGVAKKVSGDFDLTSPELAGATFTTTASWKAAPGLAAGSVVLVLTKDNKWKAASGKELPVGTVVTLSEAVPSGTGPSVAWGTPVWSGKGLTVHDDGTASFKIANGTDPVFTVTNPSTEVTGSFSVLKQVTGDGASYLDPNTGFTVSYSYEGLAEPGTLTVLNGQTVAGPDLPVGTVVTVSEVAPTGGLSSGATWGTPVFVLPDGTTSSGSATFTVASGTVLAIVLQNPTTPPPPTTPPTTPTIPNTGVNVAQASFTGFGLLIAGIAMVLLAGTRRRRGRHG